jgi:hypothetical protein
LFPLKLEEGFSLVWNSYTRWALKFPQKHDVMNLLKTAKVVSPQVIKQTESSLEPLYKLVQKSMAGGEIRKIDIDYLYQILRAQIDASIAHALKKRLTGLPLERHIQLAKAAVEKIKVADPRDTGVTLGPVASVKQYKRVQEYIRSGIEEGAELVTGGEGHPNGLEGGNFV